VKHENGFFDCVAGQKNRTLRNEGCGTRKGKTALLPYCFAERGG
jgi:hypothetical protein